VFTFRFYGMLALCLLLSLSRARSADQLSDAEEVRIGEMLAAKEIELEGLQSSPQTTRIEKYLQVIVDRVGAHADRKLPYKVHYDPNPGFRSAFGLPGGQIFIGAGLLAFADSEDQIAAVLGHEIEHIALNQCRERLLKRLAEEHLSVADANELKIEPFLPGYGKENELAADKHGVLIASAAGYSPQGAVRMLQTLLLMEQQMPNTSSEARASLENRVALIQQLMLSEHLATPKETPVRWP